MSLGTIFSPCTKYRYTLERTWNADKPRVMFIMLNPSTADSVYLDPTCARVQKYALAWGCGGFYVGNLFAYRATDPKDMKAAADPVGPLNDDFLIRMALECPLIVCAWGTHGRFRDRQRDVILSLTGFHRQGFKLHYLKLTKDGTPGHPLYLRGDLIPTFWQL